MGPRQTSTRLLEQKQAPWQAALKAYPPTLPRKKRQRQRSDAKAPNRNSKPLNPKPKAPKADCGGVHDSPKLPNS